VIINPGRVYLVAILCSFSLVACGTTEEESVTANDLQAQLTEDRVAVEKAINDVFGWAVNKDFELFFGTIADDSNFISVTPYKRVKFGVEEVKKDTGFWASPDFKAIRHELRDLKINFSRGGDVAWFFCYLDDINEWKGEPANWEDARWTGVLEKRDGKWRVVQQHFSFPTE
jgi:ketosteroid isomerase-like protein